MTDVIRTRIPSRLDRLPWARFHLADHPGPGYRWILDGLEVTIVGTVSSRMIEAGSGISISTAQIGTAGAIYVAGACLSVLFFGQLTDRFGRKKLFLLTPGLYVVAMAATGASSSPWFFIAACFFTGAPRDPDRQDAPVQQAIPSTVSTTR
jgi:MFS family permease